MEGRERKTPPRYLKDVARLSPTFSDENYEWSPSLQEILNEVSDKLKGYRSLTPTKYKYGADDVKTNERKSSPRSRNDQGRSPSRSGVGKPEKSPKGSSGSPKSKNEEGNGEPEYPSSSPGKEGRRSTKPVPLEPESSRMHGEPETTRMTTLPESSEPEKKVRFSSSKKPKNVQFKNGLGIHKYAIWYSSEMYRNKNREAFVYLSIQEFFIYIFFLITVSIIIFGSFTSNMYYYSMVISDVFTRTEFAPPLGLTANFRRTRTVEQFWAYLNTTFLDALFTQSARTTMMLTMEESKLVLFGNILVGVPRLRQLRVRPDSCKIPEDFDGIFRACYNYYKPSTEDQSSYGLQSGSQWTYSDDLALKYNGKISTYGTGGYYLNLTRDHVTVKMLIQDLFDNLWIDHGTRSVFIDFTTYSPNVNLFCIVKQVYPDKN